MGIGTEQQTILVATRQLEAQASDVLRIAHEQIYGRTATEQKAPPKVEVPPNALDQISDSIALTSRVLEELHQFLTEAVFSKIAKIEQ